MILRPHEVLAHAENRLSHNVYDNKSGYWKFDETRLLRKGLNRGDLKKPGGRKRKMGGIKNAGKSQNVVENKPRKKSTCGYPRMLMKGNELSGGSQNVDEKAGSWTKCGGQVKGYRRDARG